MCNNIELDVVHIALKSMPFGSLMHDKKAFLFGCWFCFPGCPPNSKDDC